MCKQNKVFLCPTIAFRTIILGLKNLFGKFDFISKIYLLNLGILFGHTFIYVAEHSTNL